MRGAVKRGLALTWCLVTLELVALQLAATRAAAEALVQVDIARDGSLNLVGSGWRPGQRLVVAFDREIYPTEADSGGDFEIATGLIVPEGVPLNISVHAPSGSFGVPAPPTPPLQAPHPVAVLFARDLASGAGWLVLASVGVALTVLSTRPYRRRRE